MKQKKKYLQKERYVSLYEDLNEPIFNGLKQIGFRKYVLIKQKVVSSWSFKDDYYFVYTKAIRTGNDVYIYPNFRFSYIYVSSIEFFKNEIIIKISNDVFINNSIRLSSITMQTPITHNFNYYDPRV